MIDPQYRSHPLFRSLSSCLAAAALVLCASVAFAAKLPGDDDPHRDMQPALGISDDFGRWPGSIRLVYDPDGAPDGYNNSRVLTLIEEAFSYWSTVSGLRYEIVGVDPSAPDDRNVANPFQRDGLVRISWGAIGGAAGRAGPIAGFYDSDAGYYPFYDGTIELNNDVGVIGSDDEFLHVLVHEVGHLIGLGHSDNPVSVMYANPYNFLRYPRADDIRAAQVLYGPPATPVPVDTPVPQWLYVPPPQANPLLTQNLFRPNAHPNSGNGAYFSVADTTLTSITAGTPDDAFVLFHGSLPGATEIDAKFVVVDPSGYLYLETPWPLSCPSGSVCVGTMPIAEVAVMKTVPGVWRIHVVGTASARTLYSAELQVGTVTSFNQPPVATLTAAPGFTPTQVVFTLQANDPEGEAVDVVWHPPGLRGRDTDVRTRIPSGRTTNLTVDFAQMGTHTLFVELRDTGRRYGTGSSDGKAAGDGFQTLLRLTVTLPGPTVRVVSTADATLPSADVNQQVLSAIATMPNPMLVANANGVNAVSNAPASFTYGASSNGGASTSTTFRSGDNVIIAGGVRPQALDLGKAADVFVVVRTTLNGIDTWSYRDTSGVFVPWPSVSIAQLRPAYRVASLQGNEAFEIHSGGLIAAQHRVYIGYRPSGSNTLLYTGEALRLDVGN